MFVSHPIFSSDGAYLGYLGGSIYLKELSILNELLETHYYENDSYVYVVDQNRRLIYHPDIRRVGDQVIDNLAIDAVLAGEDGAGQIRNSQGIAMLAGYAPIRNDALTDTLTGLSNRRAADISLGIMKEKSIPFSALVIDIDHFKQVNDSFGHGAGDRALKSLARIIQSCIRKEDCACRVGGEEFIILLPNTSLRTAYEIAERLRRKVADTQLPDIGSITVSIGIAEWPRQASTPIQALKKADLAMYKAKQQGRNRCEVFSMAKEPSSSEQ